MNLTALLAALRGASTPEARKAILSGLTTAQRQALNTAAGDRALELYNLAERTEPQTAEMNECLTATRDLQPMVEADAELTRSIQGIAARNQATPNLALAGVGVSVGREAIPPPGGGGTPESTWRNQLNQASRIFGNDHAITRAIACDLEAYGLRDAQVDHLASREYVDEFISWMRSCRPSSGAPLTRALNEVTIDGGAAVIPLDFIAEIIQRRAALKRVSSLVRRYQTSRDELSIPKFLGGSSTQKNDLAFQWLGAEGSATEDTSLENWGKVNIKVHRGGFVIVADRAWLEDAAFDMEAWVVEQITDAYEALIDYFIINGTGVGRPFGLATRTGTTTAAANLITCVNIGDPISFAGLMIQQGNLDAQYAANAQYLFRRSTLYTQVLSIQTGDGLPIFGTNNTQTGGTAGRVDSQLLGAPVTQSDHMAAVGAGNKVNYYGDFRAGYGLVERVTLQIEPYLDPAIQKKDQVGWYVRCRLGGDVTAEWALRCGLNTDV